MNKRSGQIVSVVDDDASLRRSVRNLLSSMGFLVEAFASAEAFLESAHRGDTGCLVLDLRMEGMDGLELLRRLTAAGIPIPTVILTAHGDQELRDRALEAGAVAFLAKPFHADVLLHAVKTAMGRER